MRFTPTDRDVRRWRRYLADEKAEAAVYRDLAARRTGEEREILLALAAAEGRHEAHWRNLLGDRVGEPVRSSLRSRVLRLLARRFGSVFVLALAQRAETRSPYGSDIHATAAMGADEQIHEEVVRALAARGRIRLSGSFRAAVFGANDGLVSNLALVLGVSGSGASNQFILVAGITGLLAGALSMAAGEYVSVRSQRELLLASTPARSADAVVPLLDVDANELALVYRARGMTAAEADRRADSVLRGLADTEPVPLVVAAAGEPARTADQLESLDAHESADAHESVGTAFSAALSSFAFFASGAVIPVLPYLFGLQGVVALIVAGVLVGLALMTTGAVVGLLSGGPPWRRALRQLAIGFGAAAITYGLGLLFGTGHVG